MVAPRDGRGILLLPVALVLFALFFDAFLAVGRASFGIEQATASRYTTYNLLLLVGVYLGLVALARNSGGNQRPERWGILGGFCLLLTLQIPTSIYSGLMAGMSAKQYRMTGADVLVNYRSAPDGIIATYVFAETQAVRRLAAAAEAYHLSVFSSPMAQYYREIGIVPGGVAGPALPVPPDVADYLAKDWRARRAWIVLSTLYDERPDLRQAFPDSLGNFPTALVSWAITAGVTVDGNKEFLLPYRTTLQTVHALLTASGARSP
jgi:hypothetical protein